MCICYNMFKDLYTNNLLKTISKQGLKILCGYKDNILKNLISLNNKEI